ncbi:EAL domain-containing protein [Dactylosporangium sp. NBC_01737]|uniref:putative bifunctional diguanylate cyclase/phosphodiesterase n=1 Tax=Dactylosporangium sp. NBC_01737 TaxID=2975959 RepID=UPI002E121577|nr:EAL domain-containing protein [Dactylosporangium sp. NBC_01737]
MALRPSRVLRTGAVLGLAAVLLGLTGVSVVGTTRTRASANTAIAATTLAEAYELADDAVALEEVAEQRYRLEPGEQALALHRGASGALEVALRDVEARGTAADRDVAAEVRELQVIYLGAMDRLFAAVDRGDTASAADIDDEVVDPAAERIGGLVHGAATVSAQEAAEAMRDLHRIEGVVFTATTATFGVGLALLVVFAFVAGGYQRRLLRHAAEHEYHASHDGLTGLPNRTLFTEHTTDALREAGPDGRGLAVLLLDLDRFKEVNDTLGHQYGDELLRQVAARTTGALRAGDVIARLSGDEFAVLLPGASAADAAGLAARLQSELHRSFALDDVAVDVEVSIGIAVAPEHATDTDALLRCADIAMYTAKDSKTGATLYRPNMHTEDGNRLLLLGDLRRALDVTDQLTLHYQPKIRLDDGRLSGAEALVRWSHPTRGPIPPAEFIPVAETTGLITRLTLYVLRLAVAQARAWLDDGLVVPIAVNLSPRCLLDPDLVGHVTRLLHEHELPADLLRLEVTETAVMANPALATETLTALHRLGVRLSIDDYGTGYSSMAYLKSLPVDELKVDRTFVMHMDDDPEDAVLVRGAIELGHNLGMTVVAEGVEGAAHVTALQELGCDIAQGYHYARPMPPEDLTTWFRTSGATAVLSG